MAYEIVKRLKASNKDNILEKLEDGVKVKEGKSKRCPKVSYIKSLKKAMMQKSVLIKISSFKN